MPGVLPLKIFGHLCIALGADKALSSPEIGYPLDGNASENTLTAAVVRLKVPPIQIT